MKQEREMTKTFIALIGARQLGTGIIRATFILQGKWQEVATVLGVIGFVFAGLDGVFLWRAGKLSEARWHAIPGASIAVLALIVAESSRL